MTGALRIGSLFSGYGGLDMAVEAVTGGRTAWVSDIDAGANKILAHHNPDVPNVGDLTTVDWAALEPVDIITGGFPCQDLSLAGARAGMSEGTRSGLWSHMAAAIETIKPRLVIAENVRGLLSGKAHSDTECCEGCVDGARRGHRRALGTVLADLARIGYDAQWVGLRASDVGAPHQRFRVFVVAENTDRTAGSERRLTAPGQAEGGWARADAGRRSGAPTAHARSVGRYGPTHIGDAGRLPPVGGEAVDHASHSTAPRTIAWGDYESAIRRWERALGRPAPAPTTAGPRGGQSLNPALVEFMMGLPEGHVCDVPGLTRNEKLKALGNGVVPQQAEAAIRYLLNISASERAA